MIDCFLLAAYGFDHTADAEVFGTAQVAFADFVDEVDGGFGEGVVGKAAAVELGMDVGGDVGRAEWL